ncbi:MAG: DNA polymerase III subunit alpha [Planctomycetia bacterium]|nr:DNA polymerase III subunit alpha [Planctomycetia bacterium]
MKQPATNSSANPFVHLHCHTHYSLLDGANRIPELCSHVKSLGMNAVAVTDHGNLYGAIELFREAEAAGIRPIVGYEAYVAPGKRTEKENKGTGGEYSYHLTMLAHNTQGFKNLIKLSSLAYLEGFYYKPRIDKEILEAHSEGITVLSGCMSSEFSSFLLKEQLKEAKKLAEWFVKVFKDRFYVEIQNNGIEAQAELNVRAIDLADKMGLPLVATCDAHYLKSGDDISHDVLLCINTGRLKSDENRMRYGSNQFYIRTPSEMYNLFPGHEEAVKRTQEIANSCEIEFDFNKRHFPVFHLPKEQKPESYLSELAEQGLQFRYDGKPSKAAKDRLKLELEVVIRLGFASYFLIVWDFVRFAREKGIPAGARGSACGSLLSYVLQISQVDPLKYDLLFERFLDPNRAEAPDIDIDFCQERREEVIQYVKQKYGEQSVAQIATFGTMAARAAIKDVGRVLGVPLDRVNALSNLIPKAPLGISIEESMEKVADLRKEYQQDLHIKEMLDIAMKLEGTNRNVGTHAAGVVIANGPITDFVPVQRVLIKGNKGDQVPEKEYQVTTQWTMNDLEKVGMLKMDFLGLRTLTLLDKAVKLIQQHRNKSIDLDALPLDDEPTYKLLQSGHTQGVFQFESEGIRNLLRSLKPDNIRDIIASTALYRPGPLQGGMVDSYVNRKHGREQPVYENDIMKDVLEETHGVMVYQEQVMRILNRLGGIELSSAYACIKAISKKKMDIIDERRAEFIKGAVKRGVKKDVAEKVFEQIVVFGGYGFNKSHSAAYAIVSYQTAYLKAHFPAEFMAAVLTSELGDTDKIAEHIRNTKEMGLTVLPPDVNQSDADFSVAGEKSIRFGLVAIRGLGRKAAQAIVEERSHRGHFVDLYNLCERVDSRLVPRSAIETLIKAGAMDSMAPDANRAAMMIALPGAVQEASNKQEDKKRGQGSIFDILNDDTETTDSKQQANPRQLPSVDPWSAKEKLTYERDSLGFYLSSHPLAQHEAELTYASHRLVDIDKLAAGAEVMIGGMLTQVRYTNAKRSRTGDTRMARFHLEDLTGTMECVMFPESFGNHKDDVVNDKVCFVKATVDRSREKPGLIVNKIIALDKGRLYSRNGGSLRIILEEGMHDTQLISQLGTMLKRTQGTTPVMIEVQSLVGNRAVFQLGADYRIDLDRLAMDDLKLLVGERSVHISAG